jgi:hypothetical protein
VTGHALYARLAAIAPSMPTMREQAQALGLSVKQVKFARYRARLAGFELADVDAEYSSSSPRLSRVEREMAGPGCGRCGLRGAHVCTSLEDYISARPGDGRTLPATPLEDDFPSRNGTTESVSAAATRHRLTPYHLTKLLRTAKVYRQPGRYWRVERSIIDRVVREARAKRLA